MVGWFKTQKKWYLVSFVLGINEKSSHKIDIFSIQYIDFWLTSIFNYRIEKLLKIRKKSCYYTLRKGSVGEKVDENQIVKFWLAESRSNFSIVSCVFIKTIESHAFSPNRASPNIIFGFSKKMDF